jgi:hypothetical protein
VHYSIQRILHQQQQQLKKRLRLVLALARIIFSVGVPVLLPNLQIHIFNNMNANNGKEKKVMTAAAALAAEQQQQQQQQMANFHEFDPEFAITAIGLFVTCPKVLKTTRFFPWDIRGPFPNNEVVECTYVIDAETMTIFSSRFRKPKVFKFDVPLLVRKQGKFRICGKRVERPEAEPLGDITNVQNHDN